jgi:hypothetical protein
MSHWFDELGNVLDYMEQTFLGNIEYNQEKFYEAFKILRDSLVACHDYGYFVAKTTKGKISDNPDAHVDFARYVYERAKSFEVK